MIGIHRNMLRHNPKRSWLWGGGGGEEEEEEEEEDDDDDEIKVQFF